MTDITQVNEMMLEVRNVIFFLDFIAFIVVSIISGIWFDYSPEVSGKFFFVCMFLVFVVSVSAFFFIGFSNNVPVNDILRVLFAR